MYKEPYNINYFKRRHFDAGAYFYADTNCMQNVFFKKMPFFLCICAFSFFTGAVCCFSANAHSHIYDTLLSMQYSKENTLDDVFVEGNVTKVEEKSKALDLLKKCLY